MGTFDCVHEEPSPDAGCVTTLLGAVHENSLPELSTARRYANPRAERTSPCSGERGLDLLVVPESNLCVVLLASYCRGTPEELMFDAARKWFVVRILGRPEEDAPQQMQCSHQRRWRICTAVCDCSHACNMHAWWRAGCLAEGCRCLSFFGPTLSGIVRRGRG